MSPWPRFCLRLLQPLLLAVAVPAGAASAETLQPWQMVRSLQSVQDRIADGDQAALPMQRKLLNMIDDRFRAATRAELADPRNFQAAMIYAMGGGNPATVQALMPDLLAAAERLDAPAPAAGEEKPAEEAAPDEAMPHDEGGKASEHGEAAAPDAEEAQTSGHGAEAEQAPAEAAAPEAAPEDGGAKPHGEGGAVEERAEEAGHEARAPEAEASGHGDENRDEAGKHREAAEGEDKKPAAPPPIARNRKLALGVFNYGRGRFRDAKAALADVDPMGETPELGAFVALIKGSLDANEDPAAALKLLDDARLLAAGTLVEEAALRRSVALAATLGDRPRFLLAGSQYVRRFLRSPYASQFADGFVAGVVVLHEGLDFDAVAAITAGMTPEQERVVYLRIARRAAIDHLTALSAFASAKAGAVPGEAIASGDPRAALYAALPGVASADTAGTLQRLEAIDPQGLTAGDRALLDAAKTVAAETLADPAPDGSGSPAPEEAAAQGKAEASAKDDAGSGGARPSSAEAAPPAAAPALAATDAGRGLPEASGPGAAPDASQPPDPSQTKVAEARKALEAVDRLLQETTE